MLLFFALDFYRYNSMDHGIITRILGRQACTGEPGSIPKDDQRGYKMAGRQRNEVEPAYPESGITPQAGAGTRCPHGSPRGQRPSLYLEREADPVH